MACLVLVRAQTERGVLGSPPPSAGPKRPEKCQEPLGWGPSAGLLHRPDSSKGLESGGPPPAPIRLTRTPRRHSGSARPNLGDAKGWSLTPDAYAATPPRRQHLDRNLRRAR